MATPRVEVYRGFPIIGFNDAVIASRGVVAINLGGPWIEVGAMVPFPHAEWWMHLASGNDGRLFRVSYAYQNQVPLSNGLYASGIKLREFNATNWSWDEVVPGAVSTGEAHTPDLATDREGRLYIAYQDGPGGNSPTDPQGSLTVVRVDPGPTTGSGGTSVEFLGGAGFSDAFVVGGASHVWSTSIEIAPDGTPWVAYEESNAFGPGSPSRAAVARYDEVAGVWSLAGSFGLGFLRDGCNMSLQIGPSGRPMVACSVEVNGQTGLQVFELDEAGNRWVRYGPICGLQDDVAISPDAGYRDYWGFRVSDGGQIMLGYRARALANKVCVRSYAPSTNTWDPVGELGFSPGTGAGGEDDFVSIAFRGEVPLVAFRHGVGAPTSVPPTGLLVYSFQ